MRKLTIFLLCVMLSSLTFQVKAAPQFKTGSVLLDDETEDAFQNWIQKIFNTAGLKQYKPRIYIVVNPEINAAASVGGHILIYSEFLLKCDNAAQFLGVMAHEVGHIAGGHISRLDAAIKQAFVPAAAAVILGGALALASRNSAPLEAALAGGSHIFERGMLKFSRTQETAADQAALTYLEKLGWPVEGLSQFLDKISKMYGGSVRDPYAMSHPLTPDRIQSIREHMRKYPQKSRSLSPEIELRFQRIKAKMMAFLEPQRALTTYKETDNSLPSQYARTIAHYRLGKFNQALAQVDSLLKQYPKDPYFHELKGQILFETGKIEEAIPALRLAASLKPRSSLIKIMLAHALIERTSTCGSREAIKVLLPLTQKHPQKYPIAWRLLGTAYGKTNQQGEAALALAEEAFLKEEYRMATSQVNRAKAQLQSNPRALTRANDLLSQIKSKGGG